MAEGWLFRLRSTLGAPHAAPAWPASDPREPARRPDAAGFAPAEPPVRTAAADEDEPRR